MNERFVLIGVRGGYEIHRHIEDPDFGWCDAGRLKDAPAKFPSREAARDYMVGRSQRLANLERRDG